MTKHSSSSDFSWVPSGGTKQRLRIDTSGIVIGLSAGSWGGALGGLYVDNAETIVTSAPSTGFVLQSVAGVPTYRASGSSAAITIAAGSSATTFCVGNDSRLSDARAPSAGSVVDASVSASAAIVGSKLDLTSGTGAITTSSAVSTGALTCTGLTVNGAGAVAITAQSTATSFTISQALGASGTGSTLTLQAQNITTGTGADLALTSGSGSTAHGSLLLQTGGTTRLTLSTTGIALTAATALASFTLSQADLTTNSGTGAPFTIHAQNETGTTSTGGGLVLASGTGTTAPGNLDLSFGSVVLGRLTGTVAQPQVQLADAAIGSIMVSSSLGTVTGRVVCSSAGILPLMIRGATQCFMSIGIGTTSTYTTKGWLGWNSGGSGSLAINTNAGIFHVETDASGTKIPIHCVASSSNIQLCGVGSGTVSTLSGFGSGEGVIAIPNATTAPTTNPTNGIILYSTGSKLGIWSSTTSGLVIDGTSAATASGGGGMLLTLVGVRGFLSWTRNGTVIKIPYFDT